MTIRVAIVDDHPAALFGIERTLANESDLLIVGTCKNSTELVDLLAVNSVDVVLTDFVMKEGRHGDGITMLRFLRRHFPDLRIVVLTSVLSAEILKSIQESDVHVIVSKTDDYGYVSAAIRHVCEQLPFVSPTVDMLLKSNDTVAGQQSDVPRLTKRETEVVRMLAEGLSIQDIAARFSRSPTTISSQKYSAMRKLGIERDAELFRYAISTGMIQASQIALDHEQEQPGKP
ncbi:response regulator transcription factor [Dyella caseinilytica]|uniref:Response regulator transcription factor n=1 Tax=Dyella caseinilytica TaxID=1849581 RepID=A0ABX7GYQ9_9GAMM|nr:response regulator transcription factor [Dyella caseinilytica]QRN55642.1 response regulator transcription factor [Dyella caseinilytica]